MSTWNADMGEGALPGGRGHMHMGKTGRRLGLLLHRSQIEAKEPPDDLIVVQRGQPSGQAGGAGGVNPFRSTENSLTCQTHVSL